MAFLLVVVVKSFQFETWHLFPFRVREIERLFPEKINYDL